jgi:hypothetical protein
MPILGDRTCKHVEIRSDSCCRASWDHAPIWAGPFDPFSFDFGVVILCTVFSCMSKGLNIKNSGQVEWHPCSSHDPLQALPHAIPSSVPQDYPKIGSSGADFSLALLLTRDPHGYRDLSMFNSRVLTN